MDCPHCRRRDQSCVLSAQYQDDGTVRRRHECKRCRVRWNSQQVVIETLTYLPPLPPPKDLAPDQPHCSRCWQWQSDRQSCGLGFPEARTEVQFAEFCMHYQAAALAA